MTRLSVALLAVALLAACDGDGSDGGAPVAGPGSVTTMVDGRQVVVVGYLVALADEVRVCEALAESFPPQCGGSSDVVIDLDLSQVDGLMTEGAVRWTDYPVELLGESAQGRLRFIRLVPHIRTAA